MGPVLFSTFFLDDSLSYEEEARKLKTIARVPIQKIVEMTYDVHFGGLSYLLVPLHLASWVTSWVSKKNFVVNSYKMTLEFHGM